MIPKAALLEKLSQLEQQIAQLKRLIEQQRVHRSLPRANMPPCMVNSRS